MVTIVTDGRSTLKWLWKGLNRSWLDALGVGFIRENNRKWDCRLRFKQATCPLRAPPFQDPHNLATGLSSQTLRIDQSHHTRTDTHT